MFRMLIVLNFLVTYLSFGGKLNGDLILFPPLEKSEHKIILRENKISDRRRFANYDLMRI